MAIAFPFYRLPPAWRSLKQEEVHRRAYETVAEAKKGISNYCATSTKSAGARALAISRPVTYTTDESR